MDLTARYARYAADPASLPFPERVTLELSDRCNLTCPMCPREMRHGDGLMAWDLYERLAREVARHPGTALVPFFRGESLMHPRFLDALRLAKSLGISPVQLSTNATLLTPEISEILISLPLDFVSFSLDAFSPAAYEQQRRGADYTGVMAHVEDFLRIRAREGGRLPEVQVSAVETALTAPEMEAFAAYWKPRVDRVRIYPQHSQDGAFGSLPDPHGARRACGKPVTDLVVTCDGQAALCCHDWARRVPLGDLNLSTLEEVWRGAPYHAVRMSHHEGRWDADPSCAGCDQWAQYWNPEGVVGRLVVGTPPWKGRA